MALDYATPMPRGRYAASPEATRLFWYGVRKLIFAGGLGLLTWGLASLAAGVDRHNAAFGVGWGVTFVVLMAPLPLVVKRGRKTAKRRRRKNRRRPHPSAVAIAAESGIQAPCGSSASIPACDSPATA